jgi:alanine racemase
VPAADYQPDSYVYINGHRFRLARIPTDATQILVDVTNAKGKAVAVGDKVCLLCDDHPVGDLAEVSFWYKPS